MSVIPDEVPPPDWYLALDGQQFGPLSEVELNKLVELGHLKADDLLWREGLDDWRPANTVLASLSPPPVQPPTPPRFEQHGLPPIAPAASPHQDRAPASRFPEPQFAPASFDPIPPDGATRPRDFQSTQQSMPIGQSGHGTSHIPSSSGQPLEPRREKPRDGKRSRSDRRDPHRTGAGRWVKRAAIFVFFASTLAAAAWYAYPYRNAIIATFTSSSGGSRPVTSASPVIGFAPTPQATDTALQKSQLWRVLKRDFPEWYTARITEASELASAQKGDAAIGLQMMQAVVDLRRRHAVDVLSANGSQLKSIATSFVGSLTRLRGQSVEACFGYISKGEVSAAYLELLAKPEHASVLQTQLVAMFEAIAEGRRLPKFYAQPRQGDYNLVVAALETRGWAEADLQLFSDSQALAKAPPTKVCQLVTDWFEAQLSLKDDEAQLRLLADALKPVVAG